MACGDIHASPLLLGKRKQQQQQLAAPPAPVVPVAHVETEAELKDKERKVRMQIEDKANREYMRNRRLQVLETSMATLSAQIAQIATLVKVSNEHVLTLGASPLIHIDTRTTQAHTAQTSKGGPADTTMKTEALKTGWLHEPLTSKPPPVLANTSIITSSAVPISVLVYLDL